jgi:hypothetical protein
MMSVTCFQLLFCFVLFDFLVPAFSIDWRFVPLVWQSCSTWYICSFSPGLLKCFLISLWETYVIYYHLGRSLKRNSLIRPKPVMTKLNKFGECIDQSIHCWVI